MTTTKPKEKMPNNTKTKSETHGAGMHHQGPRWWAYGWSRKHTKDGLDKKVIARSEKALTRYSDAANSAH